MSSAAARTLLFGGILLAILAIGLFEARKETPLDEDTRAILREFGMDRSYTARVQTRVELGDRSLSIDGVYQVDAPHEAYASESTTTLMIRETGEAHAFTLKNVSLKNTAFVSVASESSLLQRTLPLTDGWQSFESTAIPVHFSGIAVYGPILDNALLFSEDGAYLTFLEALGEGDERRYVFKLKDPRAHLGGTLESLFERIGENGRVTVWIHDGRVSQITFTGENYTSTTTPLFDENPITSPI